ncbi:MAG: hypothetical protein U0R49_08260 [Fimbriimonadales bacterium]
MILKLLAAVCFLILFGGYFASQYNVLYQPDRPMSLAGQVVPLGWLLFAIVVFALVFNGYEGDTDDR